MMMMLMMLMMLMMFSKVPQLLLLHVVGTCTCSLFKGAQSRLNNFVQFRCVQSISIFSILNHPCSVMVYYRLFDVFLSL